MTRAEKITYAAIVAVLLLLMAIAGGADKSDAGRPHTPPAVNAR